MRLFVALYPPHEVASDLTEQLAAARDRHPNLKWVPAGQLHITLLFLGDVLEDVVTAVRDAFAEVCASAPASQMRVHGAQTFGRATLWAGVDADTPLLTSIHERLADAAVDQQLKTGKRSWQPHLTLARAPRSRAQGDDVRDALPLATGISSEPWNAGSAWLIQSELTDQGAQHYPVAELPFLGQ